MQGGVSPTSSSSDYSTLLQEDNSASPSPATSPNVTWNPNIAPVPIFPAPQPLTNNSPNQVKKDKQDKKEKKSWFSSKKKDK